MKRKHFLGILLAAGLSMTFGYCHWNKPKEIISVEPAYSPLPSNQLLGVFDERLCTYQSEAPNARYAILVDYDRPIQQERLWVLDLNTNEVILTSKTSHAANSDDGNGYATTFSNVPSSNISSLGMFKTGDTYHGQWGYSLRLHGLEPGINDKALERYIVIHSYEVCPIYSLGCIVTSPETNRQLIELTKGGSLLYIHWSARDF